MTSLTRLYRDLGEMIHEQHQLYEEYYVQRFTPNATGDGASGGPTNINETVPVSDLRGVGRTAAEADADLAQITEALGRDNLADEHRVIRVSYL